MGFNPVLEFWIFLSFFVCGAVCGTIFDFFRALRRKFKLSFTWVFITDVLFWILTTAVTAFCVFYLNDGLLRSFVVVSFFIGVILYFFTVSRIVLTAFLKIITIISQFIKLFFKILLTPLKFSYKIILNVFLKFIKKFNSGVQS